MLKWRDDGGRRTGDARRRRDPFQIGLGILINFGSVAPWAATAS